MDDKTRKTVEPEEFEWCRSCREYDQEQHCCHRWTKVIRQTVEELKAAWPEVIRCRDCKWYRNYPLYPYCVISRGNHHPRPDDYCSYAQPMDNNER